MRTIEMDVFKVNELDEDAKMKAYYNWLENFDYGWSDENIKTLNAFEMIFPIHVTHWEYGGQGSRVEFHFTADEEVEELSGIRLLKYLFNNYWNDITKGKYYSLWSKTDKNPHYTKNGHAPYGKLKSRHSKVMLDEPGTGACPLTGYYMDEEILDPIFVFMKNPSDTSFYELMQECTEAWVKACNDDMDASSTIEAFMEEADANDFEFFEDGSRY